MLSELAIALTLLVAAPSLAENRDNVVDENVAAFLALYEKAKLDPKTVRVDLYAGR